MRATLVIYDVLLAKAAGLTVIRERAALARKDLNALIERECPRTGTARRQRARELRPVARRRSAACRH